MRQWQTMLASMSWLRSLFRAESGLPISLSSNSYIYTLNDTLYDMGTHVQGKCWKKNIWTRKPLNSQKQSWGGGGGGEGGGPEWPLRNNEMVTVEAYHVDFLSCYASTRQLLTSLLRETPVTVAREGWLATETGKVMLSVTFMNN